MADEKIGSVSVEITGDYSALQSALNEATSTAQSAGQTIASAFQTAANATDLAGGQLQIFQSILKADEAAGIALSKSLADMAGSAAQVGADVAAAAQALLAESAAAQQATTSTAAVGGALAQTGSEASNVTPEIQSLAEQFIALQVASKAAAAIEEFGAAALEAYGQIQSVRVGIETLTGSVQQADAAIATIKQLAETEPFSFPELAQATQKMVALGISAEQLPIVLRAAGDAAAATGTSFTTAANAIDRIALSGTVSTRQLVALGLSTQDLARVMGVAAGDVAGFFKNLDESDRINIVTQALAKFAGSAEAQAKTIGGAWQIFQNQFQEVMQNVGEALAPVVGDLLAFTQSAVGGIKEVTAAFNALPAPVRDAAVGIGLVAAALVPLAALVSGIGFAIIGFNTAWTTGAAILQRFSGAAGEAAVANTTLAASAVEATVAEEAQAVATGELATAQQALGASSGVAGVALRGFGLAVGSVVGWELGKWFVEATESAKPFETQALSIGGTLNELNPGLGLTADQLKDLDAALSTVDWSKFNDGAATANGQITDVTGNLHILMAGFDALVKVQSEANSHVDQFRLALGLAQQALANATPGTQQYAAALQVVNRAQVDLAAAIDKANVHGKDWADTVAGITQKLGESQEKFQSLVSIFGQLSAAQDNGAHNGALLAEVYTKLEAAAKASGQAFADYHGILAQVDATAKQNYATFQQLGAAYGTLLTQQRQGIDVTAQLAQVYQQWQQAASKVGESLTTAAGEMAKLMQAAQGQQASLEGVAGAFKQLAEIQNPTLTQQEALVSAFEKLNAAASSVGLSVQVAGNSILFTAKAGAEATPQLIAYAAQLNNIFTSTSSLVNINGKWQISSDALTAVNKLLADATKGAGTAAATAAPQVKSLGDAAQSTHTQIVPLNDSINNGKPFYIDGAAAIDKYSQAARGLRDSAQGTGTLIVDLNKAIGDGGIQFRSAADNAKLLTLTHGDLSDAATAARKAMADEDDQLSKLVHTTTTGTDATEKWSVEVKNADGSIGNLDVTIQGANHDVEDFGTAITNATGEMDSGKSAADDLASGYSAVAAAAYDASTAVNSLASAEKSFSDQDKANSKGGGGGPNVSSIEGWFEDVASAYGQVGSGVTLAALDQMAQLVANQTGAIITTPDETIRPQDAPKTKGANTDQYGRPLATTSTSGSSGSTSSGSSGLSSGVTTSPYDALAGAAGSAATAVSGLASASNDAVTPLGAFADSATLWAEATKSSTSAANASVPVVQALSKSASDFYTVQEKASGVVSQATQSYDSALASSINAQNAYTQALADLRNGASISADQLYALQKAVSDTSDALSLLTGEGAFGDAAQKVTTALLNTSYSANDFYTAQEKAAGSIGATTQAYDTALATSTNAQNAYSNALAQVRAGADISADALYALQKAASDAQQSLTFLSGVSKGETDGPTRASADALHLAPDVAMPPNPPAGTNDPNHTGGYRWSPNDDKWVWDPNQQGIAGHGAISGGYDPFSNPPTAPYTAHPLDVPIGSVSANNGGVPQVTIQMVFSGTVVGSGAAQQLTDMVAPKMVAILRQSGLKI